LLIEASALFYGSEPTAGGSKPLARFFEQLLARVTQKRNDRHGAFFQANIKDQAP
jgi:hypothetical protein